MPIWMATTTRLFTSSVWRSAADSTDVWLKTLPADCAVPQMATVIMAHAVLSGAMDKAMKQTAIAAQTKRRTGRVSRRGVRPAIQMPASAENPRTPSAAVVAAGGNDRPSKNAPMYVNNPKCATTRKAHAMSWGRTRGSRQAARRLVRAPPPRLWGTSGRIHADNIATTAMVQAINRKAVRQPAACPKAVPSGVPKARPSVLPLNITASPFATSFAGTVRLTYGASVDHMSPWAAPLRTRASSAIWKLGAAARASVPTRKAPKVAVRRRRRDIRQVNRESGMTVTTMTSEYTATRRPAWPSDIPKSWPISGSSPTGSSSVVTDTKPAEARIIRGIHIDGRSEVGGLGK